MVEGLSASCAAQVPEHVFGTYILRGLYYTDYVYMKANT